MGWESSDVVRFDLKVKRWFTGFGEFSSVDTNFFTNSLVLYFHMWDV